METIKETQVIANSVTFATLEKSGQTTLHCKFKSVGELLRIWESTCLIEDSGQKVKLVYAEGISLAPIWSTYKSLNGTGHFILFMERICRRR